MEPEGSVTTLQDRPDPRWSVGSSWSLHYGSFANSLASLSPKSEEKPPVSTRHAYITVAVLCYINLLNYMERYTIAGVLSDIQKFFDISDSTSGLLQTVFICSFLLLAPLFGYLGDRYNRKYIMIGGLCVWLGTAAGSSFVTGSYFWLLMLLRALVGIGEASYSTIAPTIIGDLFVGRQRSIVISVFYIFIPVGRLDTNFAGVNCCGQNKKLIELNVCRIVRKPDSMKHLNAENNMGFFLSTSGLGYITGAGCATLTGDWRWALRITPIMGVFGLILLVFLCPNPPRGAAETHGEGVSGQSSYLDDIKYLLRNKSYLWSTSGVTALAFLTGALAFWMPTFLSRAQVTQGLRPPCTTDQCNTTDSYIFGAVTLVTGILGGVLGTRFSLWFRDKVPNVDPLICAVGMIGSVPSLFITVFVASSNIPTTYVFIFFGELFLSLNWAVLTDMLLYIVVPTRRSSAEALQITVGHLLGDAGSPYLIGIISDAINNTKPKQTNADWSFHSLKYSLLLCPFVGILGGLFFLMTSLYITEDRKTAQLLVEENTPPQQGPAPEPSMELSNRSKE